MYLLRMTGRQGPGQQLEYSTVTAGGKHISRPAARIENTFLIFLTFGKQKKYIFKKVRGLVVVKCT
jgi:hypothetical protein